MLDPGRNCWRIERTGRAALIVDAADYFRLARQAMLRARKQIIMIGWDFDTRIPLAKDEGDEAPTELGGFISWLPKKTPGLQIYILKWDVGAISLLGRGSTAFRLANWMASDNIHFKLDGAHPTGASHHQKIVVIDDTLAFCGGIDITAERWDTRGHVDDDPGRKRPTTRRRYAPWHDATMAVDGNAARALGDLARKRWAIAGGDPIAPPSGRGSAWPRGLEPLFREVDVAISRTRAAHGDLRPVREIEALFVDQIRSASQWVYAENQYFASRKVAEAIIERLRQPGCPEIVIVNPRTGRGWLDDKVMSPARARLLQAIAEADRDGRFRIYSPVTEGGEDIYVHAKIMIVDGRVIRVGSANLNNRSMGLDSECDLTIDTGLQANRQAGPAILATLHDLLGEHLGAEPAAVARELGAQGGSLIGAIESLRGSGRTLEPVEPDAPGAVEAAVADNEALDPESSGDAFEPIARPGLLAALGR